LTDILIYNSKPPQVVKPAEVIFILVVLVIP